MQAIQWPWLDIMMKTYRQNRHLLCDFITLMFCVSCMLASLSRRTGAAMRRPCEAATAAAAHGGGNDVRRPTAPRRAAAIPTERNVIDAPTSAQGEVK